MYTDERPLCHRVLLSSYLYADDVPSYTYSLISRDHFFNLFIYLLLIIPASRAGDPFEINTPAAGRVNKGRPDAIRGMRATYTPFTIPESVHKKMARGWQDRISLTYLTDKFCTPGNEPKNKDFEMNQRYGVMVSTEQSLNDTNENKLTFQDWHQAWMRFLELIQQYIPKIYGIWKAHFDRIYAAPSHLTDWPTWLAYDILIRKQALHIAIDPSMFHSEVWAQCSLDVTRLSMLQTASSHQNNRYQQQQHRFPSYPNHSRNTDRFNPYQDNRPRSFQTRWRSPARCLLCAGPHPPRGCKATVQVNGRPLNLTTPDEGKSFADSDGQ